MPADWTKVVDYETLIGVPEVRARIARHAALAKKRLSGEQFLEICDQLISPLTSGVSLKTIAAIAQPLSERLGLKTGHAKTGQFREPPGSLIVFVLCSLAQNGHTLQQVTQAADGCVIEARLPSDVWSFGGELRVAVCGAADGTMVEAVVTVKGQYFDWGKSRREVDRIFSDLESLARAA
jgi:hypothetical protein